MTSQVVLDLNVHVRTHGTPRADCEWCPVVTDHPECDSRPVADLAQALTAYKEAAGEN